MWVDDVSAILFIYIYIYYFTSTELLLSGASFGFTADDNSDAATAVIMAVAGGRISVVVFGT